MNFLLKWLLNHFLFAGTMMFAAGTVADPGAAAAGGADAGAGDSGAGLDGGSDFGDVGDGGADGAGESADAAGDDAGNVDLAESEAGDPAAEKPKSQAQDDPDTAEFKGLVSNRLRAFTKKAPELAAVFQKHPDIQAQFEATMRRDAAYRDTGMTVAEVRNLRETFPNGLQDVQALQQDVKEVEELDNLFYTRDGEGNFTGHAKLVEGMFSDNREAAVALMREIPKQWAKQDPESYNDVMTKIVGATFTRRGIPEYIGELIGTAKESGDETTATGLTKLLNWVKGYTSEKPPLSVEAQQLAQREKAFKQQQEAAKTTSFQQFSKTWETQALKQVRDIVSKHPTIAKVLKVQSLSDQKKQEIVDKVRVKVAQFLAKSPSYMRKLRPAYQNMNLEEALNIQKAGWSQQWLLNSMVRKVLQAETPELLAKSRAIGRRPASAASTQSRPAAGARPATSNKPTKPFQSGGQWYKPSGERFSTSEIMRGEHLK